jgi:tRNA A-37 threonylcarbamoyl transferase component Bud32/tetratricopeptide (TPR) repeat protein
MPLLAEGVGPRYRVVRFIAEGGMGCVFEGFDLQLRIRVALKVLKPEKVTALSAERFLREARAQAQASHPNIVRIYDAFETPNGLHVLVMEFVDGPTLQQVLKKGPLSPQQVREFGVQLLGALHSFHQHGYIHRDIKPSNIFVRADQALLGDFGIASASESTDSTLTGEGRPIGTLLYMPNEQFTGRADERSDIFSLGLVLWECLTRRDPVEGRGASEEQWRGVPSDLRRVLRRAVRNEPAERWQSAAAFRVALGGVRRRWLPLAVGVALALIVATLAGGSIVAWMRAQACRAIRFSYCPAPLRPNDLAILPFGGDEDGYELAEQVALHLEGSTRIKLVPMSQITRYWDSLSPGQRAAPPRPHGATHYTTGSITRTPDSLLGKLELHDSTGRTFENFRATAKANEVDSLAYNLAESIVCQGPAGFMRDCADFRSFRFRPASQQVRARFFEGKEAVQRGDWRAADSSFKEALERDSMFMPAAWERMIALRIQRKHFSEELQFIARNLDSLPPFYRRLAIASLTPDLRERFQLFEKETRESQSGTAWLLYTNELFHRGALVGRSLKETVDTLTSLAATEPDMNHSSTYDMAWWGELRLGREGRAWQDLERRQALGPPPGDRYQPFQQLGTWARFSPWKASLAHLIRLRSPSDTLLASLKDFARLGSLMDIPAEQLALGSILVEKGADGNQIGAGLIGRAGAHLMMGRPRAAMAQLDSAASILDTPEMRLQQREWPVHLAALGLYFDSARVAAARRWLETEPLQGTDRARALYALGRDAAARGLTARAQQAQWELQALGATSRSAMRHAALLGAELAAMDDPQAALDSSSVIFIRDTTLVHLSPFARASTYLDRGRWQKALSRREASDSAWRWYESSDFQAWPTGPPQEGEMDAILSVYARLLRGELRADQADKVVACGYLNRVAELWSDVEPEMLPLKNRAASAARLAQCH